MDFNLIAQFSFFNPSTMWAILQMVLGLGAVIFVHELGHFLVAKACGVKCEKFYLGFDAFDIKIGDRVLIPRKLVHWTWGETEYGVGILPLGGYVKMLGQDDNPAQMAEERRRSMQDEEGDEGDAPKLDPRSYQAKSVPQRMAIISAGVIMNLIFAVIFAAIAFGTGVNYEPPQIGSTVPGSPAWTHNLDGATVLEIDGKSTRNNYFTFGHLREAVVFDAKDKPLELKVLPAPTINQLTSEPSDYSATTPVSVSVEPVTNLIDVKGASSLPALGIGPSSKAILVGEPPTVAGHAAADAKPPLETGDKIIRVQGKSIVRNLTDENGRPYKQYNVYLLKKLLAQNWDQTVEMVVERPQENSEETTEVTTMLPPNPMRTIGLTMKIGQIQGIQLDSPAQAAGMQIGDLITQIDGLPVGDPFTLQQRMAALARNDKTVEITVERTKDGVSTKETLTVSPRIPRASANVQENRPIAIESLGIAFVVTNEVANSSDISGPQVAEIQNGNKIVSVKFLLDDDQKKDFGNGLVKPIDLTKKNAKRWSWINFLVQRLKAGTKMEVTYINDSGDKKTAAVEIQEYKNFFQETRGFNITLEQMPFRARSVWESIQLGANQTLSDATKVLKFLRKLIKGDIPITGLGGPGTIVMAATSEASQGTSRLLLFLTLLSANLAVINFLPIPILDGGHMVFLAYEGIFRRPVSERLQMLLSFAGLIFIIGLMALVISLDVWRWSGLF